MTAEQLLANMLDVYALAGTYRDTGRVLQYFRPVGFTSESRPSVVEFRTTYAKPGRLRFEERHLHANGVCFGHKITCADGDDVRRWAHPDYSLPPPTSVPGAFGLAVCTVHPALGLLIEGQALGWLNSLTEPTLLDDADLDGAACHRVRCRCSWWDHTPTPEEQAIIDRGIAFIERVFGTRVPPGRTEHLPLTVWIDRHTLLVRRVESGTITDRACHDKVVTCQPEVGVPLDPTELLFDPPVLSAHDDST